MQDAYYPLTNKDIRWVAQEVSATTSRMFAPDVPRFHYTDPKTSMVYPYYWGYDCERGWGFYAVVPVADMATGTMSYQYMDLFGKGVEISPAAAMHWLTQDAQFEPDKAVLKPDQTILIGYDFYLRRYPDGTLAGMSGELYAVSRESEEVIRLGDGSIKMTTRTIHPQEARSAGMRKP